MTKATNRRAVLGGVLAAGAAGVTTLAASAGAGTPALSAEPDPVLALVAKVRAAWDRIGEIINEEGDDESERCQEAWRVFSTAQAELLETPPNTLVGARAAIAWFVEHDRPNVPVTSGRYLPTLIRSPIFAGDETNS